jgi:hypothetical protein
MKKYYVCTRFINSAKKQFAVARLRVLCSAGKTKMIGCGRVLGRSFPNLEAVAAFVSVQGDVQWPGEGCEK